MRLSRSRENIANRFISSSYGDEVVRRLYDDNLYNFDKPQRSYWEATGGDIDVVATPLGGDASCDVAVIGAGYTGLSAALHLARDHSVDVRVLEAGHIGWGASGRNGGFCCVGGVGVHRQDLVKRVGLDAAKEYYRSQIDAVNLVRDIGADEELDLQAIGNAELEVAHTTRAFERLKKEHELLKDQLGMDSELLAADSFREQYYDSSEQHGALILRPAFGLHPLRYCRGLAAAAARRGAILHQHSEVLAWSKSDDGRHRLTTAGGTLRAKKVVFSTNGFMPEGLRPEFYARTLPVISAIIVTRPLNRTELAAQRWINENPAINSRQILNYFRLLSDNRFLFGGRGHTSGSSDGERKTYERLADMLYALFPSWMDIEIEYRWHGLICMTGSMCPAVGQLVDDNSVYFSYGYHGNGVNTATWSGRQIADWIGHGREPGLPSIVKGMTKKFPLARLRRKYLQLAIGVASLSDRLG